MTAPNFNLSFLRPALFRFSISFAFQGKCKGLGLDEEIRDFDDASLHRWVLQKQNLVQAQIECA